MNLQDRLRNHKELPSQGAWLKIQKNLESQKKSRPKVSFFTLSMMMKIAAIFVIGFIGLFSMNNMFRDHNADLFASNNNAPIKLEELGNITEPYFSIEHIEGLKKAYTSISK